MDVQRGDTHMQTQSFDRSRRVFLASSATAIGAAAVGLYPTRAEAIIPLLLRGLALGGARAGAAGLAGRSALAGQALLRPSRPAYASNGYGNAVQTGRLVFQAGRWLHQANNSPYMAQYSDPNEYQYDYARYPGVFGAAPANLWVENRFYDSQILPESDLYLRFNNGQVWQSYRIGELCVPPGLNTYDVALTGVPTGWGYSGVFTTGVDAIGSNYVDS
jgi:hypothetical protein